MTILYVDDDPDDRQIFEEAISAIDKHHVCLTAQDGIDALSYLGEGKFPDIIFLDINMPLMDGRACLSEIRTNKETAHIPVIMFTTSNNPEDRTKCEHLGATDFFLKPFSYPEMKKILATVLITTKIQLH